MSESRPISRPIDPQAQPLPMNSALLPSLYIPLPHETDVPLRRLWWKGCTLICFLTQLSLSWSSET